MKYNKRLYASTDIASLLGSTHKSLEDLLIALEWERAKSYPFTFVIDKNTNEKIKAKLMTRDEMLSVLNFIVEAGKAHISKPDEILSLFDEEDKIWNKQIMEKLDKKTGGMLNQK